MSDTTLHTPVVGHREIPHTVSPGLWTLAWRRLKPVILFLQQRHIKRGNVIPT